MMSRSPERSQAGLVIVLLVISLGSTVFLASEAFQSTRRNRLVAESIVRDNARVAGEELVRRGGYEIAYYGFSPALRAVAGWAQRNPGAELPEPGVIAATANPRQKAGLRLATAFVILSPAGDVLRAARSLSDDEIRWLRGAVAGDLKKGNPAEGDVMVLHRAAGLDRVPYAWMLTSDGPARQIVAIRSDPKLFSSWIRKAYDRQPLLPVALGNGTLDNSVLFVQLQQPGGTSLFRAGSQFNSQLGIEETAVDPSGPLDGLRLRASVEGQAVPRMIIGGMPRSRLPQLLLSIAVSIGLLAAAIVQLQRQRALERLRSDFVSSVSHELRTPLTQIRMFAETLLLDRVRSAEEQRRSIVIIDQEARRLSQLVENILLFSRGERGALGISREPVDIAALVVDTAENFAPIARAMNVSITTDLQETATLNVDADAVRQILLNLLDNAVKYGPPGQRVTVSTSRTSDGFRVAVTDQGPGVPPAEREEIWRKFRRLDRDRDTHRAGTGIGLSLVRELMILHGGRAWVEPAGGNGARFVIEFPPALLSREESVPVEGSA